MKLFTTRTVLCLAISMIVAPLAQAQWHGEVGAQSGNMGIQMLAFLPNEMWIHAGDSITWTFDADEPHTVTFLPAGALRLPFPVGCPGVTPSGSSFDGSSCVNTGPLVQGQTYTVNFPTAGNYKLVCLVHEDMTGTVHVLPAALPLPHNQDYYDNQAAAARHDMFSDADHGEHDYDHMHNSTPVVTVGHGEISATAGGHSTLSVMRFMQAKVVIHAGDTVEWDNHDPITPHTITFGTEPADPVPPSTSGVFTTDADGALHGTINSSADNVHSGFIISAPQERIGLSQAPLGNTRFRITFTHSGVYPYICELHDMLGMKGQVVVQP